MVKLLEIASLTTNSPGVVMQINCAPIALNDGEEYFLSFEGFSWPSILTGSENVVVQVKGSVSAHFLGDDRARWVSFERIRRSRGLRLVWTQHSIATVMSGANVTPVGAFIVRDGIAKIP